jgi:hypothetical protein
VNDQFELSDGNKIWVPGVHVNCRCRVNLVEPMLVQKDLHGPELQEFNEEHPRGRSGRFTRIGEQQAATAQAVAMAPHPEMVHQGETAAAAVSPLEEPHKPVEMPTTTVGHKPVEMRAGVEMRRPVELRAPVGLRAPVELRSPVEMHKPVEMATTETGRKPVEMTRAPVQMSMDDKRKALEMTLQRRSVEMTAKRKALEMAKPQLPEVAPVAIGETIGLNLDKPFYAVMKPKDTDRDSVHYEFNQTEFKDNELSAVHNANDLREQAIEAKYNQLMGGMGTYNFRIWDPANNTHFQGQLSGQDVRSIIETMARADVGEDINDQFVNVEYSDSEGTFMGDASRSVWDLSEYLNIDRGDFAYHVVEVNRIHEDQYGHVPGSKSTQERYVLDGQYEAIAEDASSRFSWQKIAIPILEVQPFDPRMGRTYPDLGALRDYQENEYWDMDDDEYLDPDDIEEHIHPDNMNP